MNIFDPQFGADTRSVSYYSLNECRSCKRNLVGRRRVSFPCEHVFCRDCFGDFVHNTGEETCPVCSEGDDESLQQGQHPRPDVIIPPSERQDFVDRRPVLAQEARCGICGRREGETRRGRIHCCDHFFCFDCILQWGQDRPHCPICRRSFFQIESEYSESQRMTRQRSPFQNAMYDLPQRRWIFPQDSAQPQHNYPVYVQIPVCALCGVSGFLRRCESCPLYIHHACADPIWSTHLGRWLCAVCVRLPENQPR